MHLVLLEAFPDLFSWQQNLQKFAVNYSEQGHLPAENIPEHEEFLGFNMALNTIKTTGPLS